MKAFVYTLVLTIVLVACVMLLRSIGPRPPLQEASSPAPDGGVDSAQVQNPMVVKSKPANPSIIDPDRLETVNQAALYETGLELLDLWHLPEAIDVFEKIVENDPGHLPAYLRLVECYSHPVVGHERRARRCWEIADSLARASGSDTLLVSAFGELFVEERYEAATQHFEGAALADNEESAFLLASALLGGGQPEQAAQYLEDQLDRDQSLGRVRELLIRCRVAEGRSDDAERLARNLASIYPEEPYPYVLLSRVLLVRGKVDEAVEFGNNALLLDDKYIPAIVARAHLYVAEGELAAAGVTFEKLLLFDDAMLSSIGKEGMAYIGFLSGRFDEAMDNMDESIRLAMGVGSTRRGLRNAFRQVSYLCELGRADAARIVVDRWMTRHGQVPAHIARIRVRISEGEHVKARQAIERIADDPEWQLWMRILRVDPRDLEALTFIQANEFAKALDVLNTAGGSLGAGDGRRAYLKGFAAFRSGEAEAARDYFEAARVGVHSLEFPYHSDPILYVQSLFFLAEVAVATGDNVRAAQHYQSFLQMWGDSMWELPAVDRARQKLATLSGMSDGSVDG